MGWGKRFGLLIIRWLRVWMKFCPRLRNVRAGSCKASQGLSGKSVSANQQQAISKTRMLKTSIALTFLASLMAAPALAGTSVPINRIDFAGAGGDFTQRYGSFEVPDSDTSRPAYSNGRLSRYDVHIAKMIEVTHHHWCLKRENYKGVHYNYSADNGKVFMGKIYISCALAAQAFEEFGQGRAETTAIYNRGNGPEWVEIPVLDLNGKRIPAFQKLVASIKPQCINQICPGDRNR